MQSKKMDMQQRLFVTKASAGTGKTYTLAAHYIALLMHGESYRNILAVTFTNKATAEMKERILTYLNAPTQPFMDKVNEVAEHIGLNRMTYEQMQNKASQLVKDILADYDNMKICTIDSFLQTLLAGLADALGQVAGYGVDLDLEHAIATAVDEVLSEDTGQQKHIMQDVAECIRERLVKEEKWDLRPELIQLAQEMFKEEVQNRWDRIPCGQDMQRLKEYKTRCQQQLDALKASATYQQIAQAYQNIQTYESALISGMGGKNYAAYYRRTADSLSFSASETDCFRGLGATDRNRLDNPTKLPQITPAALCELAQQIDLIADKGAALRAQYLRYKYRMQFLDELLLVGYVLNRIRYDLRENNTILLAQTANTLARALKHGDAEFILLKAGIRYKHIMLDEFQDTSQLQWENFRRLIHEILSEGGSTLIVGDVKQSIYRWRSGDYEIMNGLNNPQREKDLSLYYNEDQLPTNRRSGQEIVQFTRDTFEQLCQNEPAAVQDLYACDYDWVREGGHVEWQTYRTESKQSREETKERLLIGLFNNMERVLQAGYQPKDLLILIRNKKEGKRVLEGFARLVKGDTTLFPLLNQAGKIISGDSFVLDYSIGVNVLISALKGLFRQDATALEYVKRNSRIADMEALHALDKQLPLTELLEQITRLCLCPEGEYQGHDIAHMNCFKDKVRGYVGRYGSDVDAFLTYWNDKMHSDAIPAAGGSDIIMMTIHASKGLEGKNVFIPYCNWEMEENGTKRNLLWCAVDDWNTEDGQSVLLPIAYKNTMAEAGFEADYEQERLKQRIDNLNLLYVALTRARDNLFISALEPSEKNIGGLLQTIYGEQGQWGMWQDAPVSKQASSEQEPFSFEQAECITGRYGQSHTDIAFRQSQKARDMMAHLTDDRQQEEHIEFGNLCHAVLEQIGVREDADRVIQDFYLKGQIQDEPTRQHITHLVTRLLDNPIARDWFSNAWTLMREDTVLVPKGQEVVEKRMDRVMIRGNEAVVLDYKFVAHLSDEHRSQVREYMDIMSQLGYKTVRGYLWSGFEGKLEEVKA